MKSLPWIEPAFGRQVATLSVPDERAIAAILACGDSIAQAATVPDIKRVIAHAEALALLAKKIDASDRVRKMAERLALDAEVQLGAIVAKMPRRVAGGASLRGQLTRAGFRQPRCSEAQRLAQASPAAVDAAFEKARTINGVKVELGIRNPPVRPTPKVITDEIERLASDAVDMLLDCSSRNATPDGAKATQMRERLDQLRRDRKAWTK